MSAETQAEATVTLTIDGSRYIGYNPRRQPQQRQTDRLPEAAKKYWNSNFLFHSERRQGRYILLRRRFCI